MVNKNILFIGGTFDSEGGKNSKLASQLFYSLDQSQNNTYYNGGNFSVLEQILTQIPTVDTVYWFANVPNEYPKLVKDIKTINPHIYLITSKRNIEKKYSFGDLVYHALGNKSNLLLEITEQNAQYKGSILDPLGNVFADNTADFSLLGKVLEHRLNELRSYTRMESTSIGPALEIPPHPLFFNLVQQYGGKFHELLHTSPNAINRFLGNASFRCERGFPSFRNHNMIYVSQRNIDKRFISKEGFVAVEPELPLIYYGDKKPSVDTPIQVKLYQYYSQVNYILHGHVYIKDAPFTSSIIPCGALEEADEIFGLYPNKNKVNFAVNLRGHGSLILVDSPKKMADLNYFARPAPELHPNYYSSIKTFI